MSNDFLTGTVYSGTTWIGLSPAMGELDTLIADIQKTPQIIGNTFSGLGWIETDHQRLHDRINTMYTTYKDKKLTSPSDGSTKNIPSLLISNLGPSTKE